MLNFEKNFIPLVEQLELMNIKHEIKVSNDGLKIVFGDGSDIALSSYTYGHEDGLLEGYNGKFVRCIYDDCYDDDDCYDEITPYLDYKKALKIITS